MWVVCSCECGSSARGVTSMRSTAMAACSSVVASNSLVWSHLNGACVVLPHRPPEARVVLML